MRLSRRCLCLFRSKRIGQVNDRIINTTPDNRFTGLVGGFAFKTPGPGHFSPALAFVDEVFLNNGIRDRVLKTGYPRHNGSVDLYPATFLQNNYTIAYSAFFDRIVQAKLQDSASSDGRVNWPHMSFDKIKNCIGRGVQLLQKQGITEIYVDPFTNAEAAAEATFLAAFRFDELKNPRRHLPRSQFHCFTAHLDNDPDCFEAKNRLMSGWTRGRIMAQSQNLARRWMEMPANLFSPKVFAHTIEEVFSNVHTQSDTKVEVLLHDRDWCIKQNMGGVLGVSAGSSHEPIFVEINYVGDKSRSDEHIALVGKGVTFDAGGISIKPSANMEDMRADMGGAAVIAATVLGIAKLGSPINIRAYLPLVENMPDGGAIRPGDVLRMANNMTVQVDNTDAEGRLILADALHFATHNPASSVPPSFVLDAATLTGAISTALGDKYTGLFSNNMLLRTRISDVWPPRKWVPEEEEEQEHDEEEVLEEKELEVITQHSSLPSVINCMNYCGRVKNDPFWHMPSLYGKELQDNCHLADLSNITTGAHARLGGSGSAASFLQYFVNYRIPYMHLDIAGVMKASSDEPYMRRGMTGRPVRSLIHFFDHIARRAQGTKPLPTTSTSE